MLNCLPSSVSFQAGELVFGMKFGITFKPDMKVERIVALTHSIQKAGATPEETDRNPPYEIIGIVKGGPVDGAENHDKYLYGDQHS